MFCEHCGEKKQEDAKFCSKCGKTALVNESSQEIKTGSDLTIKCGNCEYIGPGEPARTLAGKILAWLCNLIAWPITVIYFVATSKYRCPKCKSTFVGVKNEHGVFTMGRGGAVNGLIIIFIVLVAIAIIGILSSVVLASLNTARAKGADAAIKSNLSNARARAEIYSDYNDSSYYGVCSNAQGISSFKNDAIIASGGNVVCNDSKTAWAMSAPLKTMSSKSWCVDSTGASQEISGGIINQTSCF